jgi:hypothetical protein
MGEVENGTTLENNFGPIQDATPEVQSLSDKPEVKLEAIKVLHDLPNQHFTDTDKDLHFASWKYVKPFTDCRESARAA